MQNLRKKLSSFRAADAGVAAIEFAFILPFMLFLFFGMVDLTGLITNSRKVTASAHIVADLVAQNKGNFVESAANDYFKAVEMVMKPTPVTGVHIEVFGYRPQGGSVVQVWSIDNGGGPSCGPMPTAASLMPLVSAGKDLVVGRTCMNYVPRIATFLGEKLLGKTSFLLEDVSHQAVRSGTTLDCQKTATNTAAC